MINDTIESAIGKFLIEKEYNEFISILKFYISSKPTSSSIVHIIYSKDKTIILDENESIISITENIYDSKYISDISFSTNDYILNFLLNSLPQKIIIHYNTDTLDDFLLTLKLTFEEKIVFCRDCDLCRKYIPTNTNLEKERRH
ncbi:YtxC-like family protein [compost metagenome]